MNILASLAKGGKKGTQLIGEMPRSSFYYSMRHLQDNGYVGQNSRGSYAITKKGLEEVHAWYEWQKHRAHAQEVPSDEICMIIGDSLISFVTPQVFKGVRIYDIIRSNKEYMVKLYDALLGVILGFKLKLPGFGYERGEIFVHKFDDLAIILWREPSFKEWSTDVMTKLFRSKLFAHLRQDRVEQIKKVLPDLKKYEIDALNALILR